VYVAPAFFAFGDSKLVASEYDSFISMVRFLSEPEHLSQLAVFERATAVLGPVLHLSDLVFLIGGFALFGLVWCWRLRHESGRENAFVFSGVGAALLLFVLGLHWVLFEYAVKWRTIWVLMWGVPLIVLGSVAAQGLLAPRMRFPLVGITVVLVLLASNAVSWTVPSQAISAARMPESWFEPIDWVKAHVPEDSTVLAVGDWPGTSAALFGRPAGTMRLPFANIVFSDESVEISCLDGFVPSRGFSFTHCARTRSLLGFDVVVVPQTTGGFASSFSRALADFRNLLARSGFVVAHRTTAHEIWRKKTG
jgi:hypothetical protein